MKQIASLTFAALLLTAARAAEPSNTTQQTVFDIHKIDNISFDDISLTVPGGGTAVQAAIRNVPEFVDRRPEFGVLGNEVPFAGFYARHVKGLTLSNVRVDAVNPEARPGIVCEEVAGVEIAGAKLGAAFAGDSVIRLHHVKDAAVRDCSSPGAAASFVRVEDSETSDVVVLPNNRYRALKEIQFVP